MNLDIWTVIFILLGSLLVGWLITSKVIFREKGYYRYVENGVANMLHDKDEVEIKGPYKTYDEALGPARYRLPFGLIWTVKYKLRKPEGAEDPKEKV